MKFNQGDSVDSLLNYNGSQGKLEKSNDSFEGESSIEAVDKSAFSPMELTRIDEIAGQ
jgi:hypothetical protein